jgi:hypothetical protein
MASLAEAADRPFVIDPFSLNAVDGLWLPNMRQVLQYARGKGPNYVVVLSEKKCPETDLFHGWFCLSKRKFKFHY